MAPIVFGILLLQWVLFLLALNLLAWFVAKRWLAGEDLTRFDRPTGDRFSHGDQPGAEIEAVVASFSRFKSVLKEVPLHQRTKALRAHMDKLFAERDFSGFSFVPIERDGVVGEWVLALDEIDRFPVDACTPLDRPARAV